MPLGLSWPYHRGESPAPTKADKELWEDGGGGDTASVNSTPTARQVCVPRTSPACFQNAIPETFVRVNIIISLSSVGGQKSREFTINGHKPLKGEGGAGTKPTPVRWAPLDRSPPFGTRRPPRDLEAAAVLRCTTVFPCELAQGKRGRRLQLCR